MAASNVPYSLSTILNVVPFAPVAISTARTSALSVLKALPNARKIALLGDMLELGDASVDGHRHTGEGAADAGVDVLIAYGARSAALADAAKARGVATVQCHTAEEVLQYLRQFVRPGDAVLAKASHAMGLEQLLQDFYAELPQG